MKPVPWFWIVRVVLSTAAVVAWDTADPHASVWQLFLVCIVTIAGIEGLRIGYRQEQARIRARIRARARSDRTQGDQRTVRRP